MEEPSDNAASEAALPPRDYTDVGDHVAAILNAAEEAASRIRTDASREAETLRADAESKASAHVEERRREAELEADRLVAGAVADAQAIHTAAEAAARRIAEVGHQKLEGLRTEARALEGRFETAIDDLRDLTAQLEEVVVGAAGRSEASAESRSRSSPKTSGLRRSSPPRPALPTSTAARRFPELRVVLD